MNGFAAAKMYKPFSTATKPLSAFGLYGFAAAKPFAAAEPFTSHPGALRGPSGGPSRGGLERLTLRLVRLRRGERLNGSAAAEPCSARVDGFAAASPKRSRISRKR